nr:FCD domain-containing protein [Microvirga sp. HBU65207]
MTNDKGGVPTPGRGRMQRMKLSDQIAEDLRRWIAREGLKPGNRLPNEKTLMQHYSCAKGTLREALKALEVQGLVKMQTGPNGGAEIQPVSIDAAMQQLRSYLHFQVLDFEQVYVLRRSLEVSLAESVVGRLTEDRLQRLETNIEQCVEARDRGDRVAGRRLEIEFHDILCESCDNPLLAFICRFLNGLLRDLVEFRSVGLARARLPRTTGYRPPFGRDPCACLADAAPSDPIGDPSKSDALRSPEPPLRKGA